MARAIRFLPSIVLLGSMAWLSQSYPVEWAWTAVFLFLSVSAVADPKRMRDRDWVYLGVIALVWLDVFGNAGWRLPNPRVGGIVVLILSAPLGFAEGKLNKIRETH